MNDFFLLILMGLSFALGSLVSSGKWKTINAGDRDHYEVHIESLRILLDEAEKTIQKHIATINVLKEELEWVNEDARRNKEEF